MSGRFEELQNKFNDRYVILHQDLELEIVRGEPPAMDPASDEEPAEAVKLSVTVVTETDYGDERTFELDKQAVLQHSPVLRHLAIEQGARLHRMQICGHYTWLAALVYSWWLTG